MSQAGEEEAVGTAVQKASFLELPLGPNSPFLAPSCSSPGCVPGTHTVHAAASWAPLMGSQPLAALSPQLLPL